MTDFFYPVLRDEKNLPFYVTGIGTSDDDNHIRRDEGSVYSRIVYCVRGEGRLVIDSEEFFVGQGQGFYLPKDFSYEYFPAKEIWELRWIDFDGREIPRLMEMLQFEKGRVFDISDSGAMGSIDTIFKKILFLLKTNYYYSGHKCSALLYQLLLELNRCVNLQNFHN